MTLGDAVSKIEKREREAAALAQALRQEKQAYQRGRRSGLRTALRELSRLSDEGCEALLLESLLAIEKSLCAALQLHSPAAPLYRVARDAKMDIADAIELLRCMVPKERIAEPEAAGWAWRRG